MERKLSSLFETIIRVYSSVLNRNPVLRKNPDGSSTLDFRYNIVTITPQFNLKLEYAIYRKDEDDYLFVSDDEFYIASALTKLACEDRIESIRDQMLYEKDQLDTSLWK